MFLDDLAYRGSLSLAAAQLDRFRNQRKPGSDHRLQSVEPALLLAVVLGQIPGFAQVLVDGRNRRVIGLQVVFLAREEVAALTCLGVLELGQRIAERIENFVSVRLPLRRDDELLNIPIC